MNFRSVSDPIRDPEAIFHTPLGRLHIAFGDQCPVAISNAESGEVPVDVRSLFPQTDHSSSGPPKNVWLATLRAVGAALVRSMPASLDA
jgi:hypothetical protein